MARYRLHSITLDPLERLELERRSAAYTLPYYQVVRAKMILYAAKGLSDEQIAQRLDTRRQIVERWRERFRRARLSGLEEECRPGRPRSFSP